MTTDTKQPPDTDRFVLVKTREGIFTACFKAQPDRYSTTGRWFRVEDVEDWREMPSWDRLAILDRYDEERKEWERRSQALTDDLNKSICAYDELVITFERSDAHIEAVEEENTALGAEIDDLAAQVTALTEERDQRTEDRDRLIREKGVMVAELLTRGTLLDEALARYDEERAEWEARVTHAEDKCIEARDERDALRSQVTALTEERDRLKTLADELDITTAGRWRALAIEERARADRSEKERDEAMARLSSVTRDRDSVVVERNEARVDAQALIDEREELVAERDRAIAERDDLGCQLEALRAVQRGDVADLRTRMDAVERWRADVERLDSEPRRWDVETDDDKGGA